MVGYSEKDYEIFFTKWYWLVIEFQALF
jgi:hypothetical protein